jgi:hypothetical protein
MVLVKMNEVSEFAKQQIVRDGINGKYVSLYKRSGEYRDYKFHKYEKLDGRVSVRRVRSYRDRYGKEYSFVEDPKVYESMEIADMAIENNIARIFRKALKEDWSVEL